MNRIQELQLPPEEVARLLRLPQRKGTLWLGDCQPLSVTIAGEGGWGLALWQEPRSGIVRVPAPPHELDRPAAEVMLESLQVAMQAREGRLKPARPETVAVRQELVQALGPPLTRLGIKVTPLEDPDVLVPLFQEFEDALIGSRLSYLRPPGVTAEHVHRLFEAAGALWDLAPWEDGIDDQLLFQVEGLNPPELSFSVMGAAGIERGLSIYLDLPAVQAMAMQDHEQIQSSNLISFTYTAVDEIPQDLLEEVEANDWPFIEDAFEDLVPTVLSPGGGTPGLTEHVLLQDLLELVHLLWEQDDFLQRCRPGARTEVELADGRQVAVRLADLLEVGYGGLNRQQKRKQARRLSRR